MEVTRLETADVNAIQEQIPAVKIQDAEKYVGQCRLA